MSPTRNGRHLISDSRGTRYLVPVPSALDPTSPKLSPRFPYREFNAGLTSERPNLRMRSFFFNWHCQTVSTR